MNLFGGALELAGKIRRREISPVEVLKGYIAQIERMNPLINAVVDQRFEAAMKEAEAAEEKVMAEKPESLPVLLGVPFSTKELISMEGLSFTCGSLHLKGQKAKHDSTVVKRMREAGAIPIAVTNVPEWGLWFENYNLVYGRTKNPYDLNRTPGGSSGGEAALIAAGGTGFGMGSDVGGSIRMPAAFCGIFGHKPSRFIVPITGHQPLMEENAHLFNERNYSITVLGPMSRSSKDLLPLMKIMAGPDGYDRQIKTDIHWQGALDPIDWRKKKIFVLSNPHFTGASRAEEEVEEAVIESARVFTALGASVLPIDENIFKRGLEIWYEVLKEVEGPTFNEILTGGRKISFVAELLRSASGRARYTLPALMFAMGEKYWPLGFRKNVSLSEARHLQRKMDRLFADGDSLLLLPPHSHIAWKHNAPLLKPIDFIYTGIFNALDYPATVAPCGLSLSTGMPLSTQIVAGRNQDIFAIRAAEVLEKAFGGFQIPNLAKPTTRAPAVKLPASRPKTEEHSLSLEL